MIGTRVGNWRLEEEIGHSPIGTVYRAQALDHRPGEPTIAAVKIIDLALAREPAFQQRFSGEMLHLRRLNHPNIARIHDAGLHAGLVYYAAEYAPGQDMAAMLAQAPQGLSWSSVVHRVAVQAARALKHAHHRSILHRDLKPANLILHQDGSLKMTSFGVAKVLNLAPLSLPTAPLGAIFFLAPEHFTGKPVTRKSDLYALGAVLYTLVCGRPPFLAATAAEFMHKHCYMLPERPINLVPTLPADVDELLCSLLMKDPARRPASAAAVLEELERIRGRLERQGETVLLPPQTDDPTGIHSPLDPQEDARTSPAAGEQHRRTLLRRSTAILAMLAVVIGLLVYAFNRPRPRAEELWSAAQSLLESDDPADWERARSDYLEPLERWHPDAYVQELASLKRRLALRRELLRAIRAGEHAEPASEAERIYREALALAQNGQILEARRIWQALTHIFTQGPADQEWVSLARLGLHLTQDSAAAGPEQDARLQMELLRILDDVKKLRADGKTSAADQIISSLQALYRHRPEILALLNF